MSKVKQGKCLGEILYDYESWPFVLQFVFYPAKLTKPGFYARLALFIFVIYLTGSVFHGGYDSWIVRYLHNLNLPVHEFGHPFFGLLQNDLLTSLGGSIAQSAMPFIFCLALWIKQRDLFGASLALWWVFETIIDTAEYVEDALVMQLPLTIGMTGAEAEYGGHDWNYILSELGLLLKYDTIAAAFNTIGYIGMFFCILWGGFTLFYCKYILD